MNWFNFLSGTVALVASIISARIGRDWIIVGSLAFLSVCNFYISANPPKKGAN